MSVYFDPYIAMYEMYVKKKKDKIISQELSGIFWILIRIREKKNSGVFRKKETKSSEIIVVLFILLNPP